MLNASLRNGKRMDDLCENCVHCVYDDEDECYVCECSLDSDEMERFLTGNTASCNYFQLYDEYGIVRKQN